MSDTNQKLAALRRAMHAVNADACLIPSSDPHLSEYLPAHWRARSHFSGFTGSAGTLVVGREKSALWTDGRYFIQAERQLHGSEIELMRMAQKGVPTVSAWLADLLQDGETLALDGMVTAESTVRELRRAFGDKQVKILDADLAGPCWEGRPAVPATQCYVHEVCYAGLSAAEKLAAVREELKKQNATALLVTRLDSAAWLTNLRASDIDYNPFALCFVFVTQSAAWLFIDASRLPGEALAMLRENGIEVRGYGEIRSWLAGYTGSETVLADAGSISHALWSELEKNAAFTVKEGAEPIQALKGVKNPTEIENLKNSHRKDGAAMVRFQLQLEAKMAAGERVTECDIAAMLRNVRFVQPACVGESFDTIAAYGPNAAMMHYSAQPATCAVLAPRGFLLVDSGAQYLDGTTDITRTYALGELTEEEKRWYTLVLKSHIDIARAVFMEGCTGGNLDILARSAVWQHGIDYRCGTGHGVGFLGGVHEGPQSLRITNNVKFVPGMTVTDEPGIYEEGKVGIRIENELLCVKKMKTEYGVFLGFEPFTYCPIDTTPVLVEMLTADELEWLNSYHAMVLETLKPLLKPAEVEWLAAKCAPLG